MSDRIVVMAAGRSTGGHYKPRSIMIRKIGSPVDGSPGMNMITVALGKIPPDGGGMYVSLIIYRAHKDANGDGESC